MFRIKEVTLQGIQVEDQNGEIALINMESIHCEIIGRNVLVKYADNNGVTHHLPLNERQRVAYHRFSAGMTGPIFDDPFHSRLERNNHDGGVMRSIDGHCRRMFNKIRDGKIREYATGERFIAPGPGAIVELMAHYSTIVCGDKYAFLQLPRLNLRSALQLYGEYIVADDSRSDSDSSVGDFNLFDDDSSDDGDDDSSDDGPGEDSKKSIKEEVFPPGLFDREDGDDVDGVEYIGCSSGSPSDGAADLSDDDYARPATRRMAGSDGAGLAKRRRLRKTADIIDLD